MKIWIVRKHVRAWMYGGFLSAYTIASTHATKADALAEVKARQKRSSLLWTVGCVQLKRGRV